MDGRRPASRDGQGRDQKRECDANRAGALELILDDVQADEGQQQHEQRDCEGTEHGLLHGPGDSAPEPDHASMLADD